MRHTFRYTLAEALQLLEDRQLPHGPLASAGAATEWHGGVDYAQAARMAAFGWQEKGAELEQLLLTLHEPPTQHIWDYDLSGAVVDVGRFVSNEPECMLNPATESKAPISLLANISASAYVPAEYIFNRGFAVASVVYSLQCLGYPVSLEALTRVEGGGDCLNTTVCLSSASEYLDPSRIAFWLVHPAALRRCVFRLEERMSAKLRRTFGCYEGFGYGMPCNLPDAEQPEGVIYIPQVTLSDEFSSLERARAHVLKLAEERGIAID